MLSAGLLYLAFPPVALWPLSFISLALLTLIVRKLRPGWAFLAAFIWATLFFLAHISWMLVATDNSFIAWIALSVSQAFFIALWGLLFSWGQSRRFSTNLWLNSLVAALLWTGFEQIRSRWPFGGFPWAKLAYGQVDSPILNLAPWGGEVAISFFVAFVGALLSYVLLPKEGRSRWLVRITALASCAVVSLATLFIPMPNIRPVSNITIATIQGNVQQPQLETFYEMGTVTTNHVQETERMLSSNNDVELILWGENSLDHDPAVYPKISRSLARLQHRLNGVPLFVGYVEYRDSQRYNWVGTWDPQTKQLGSRYGKQHPVPWGEYVPLRSISESLATQSAQISVDMVPVQNPGIVKVTLATGEKVTLATVICFEVAYQPIVTEGVRLGGEALIIPTNNAQFDDSAESVQQLQMARLRAAETNRATAQVSTNGVSAIINPRGKIMSETAVNTADYLVQRIPLFDTLTFTTLYAQWIWQIAAGFVPAYFLLMLISAIRRRKATNN